MERREATVQHHHGDPYGVMATPGETYTGSLLRVQPGRRWKRRSQSRDRLTRTGSTRLRWSTAMRCSLNRGRHLAEHHRRDKGGRDLPAYGEGKATDLRLGKRRRFGSLVLWWEGENREKIWLYHRDVPDCGAMVLNEEIIASEGAGLLERKGVSPLHWPSQLDGGGL